MPNGKIGDNPLSDLTIHGEHTFPADIENLLLQIDAVGRKLGRWPLGENWPFSPREVEWSKGGDLESARRLLTHLLELIKAGRGDEVLVNPRTGRPLQEKSVSVLPNMRLKLTAPVLKGRIAFVTMTVW